MQSNIINQIAIDKKQAVELIKHYMGKIKDVEAEMESYSEEDDEQLEILQNEIEEYYSKIFWLKKKFETTLTNRNTSILAVIGLKNVIISFLEKYSAELVELGCSINTEDKDDCTVLEISVEHLPYENMFRNCDSLQRLSAEYRDTEFSLSDDSYRKYIDVDGEIQEEGMDQFISFENGKRIYYSVHA